MQFPQHRPEEELLLDTLDAVLRRGWLLRGVVWWECETDREHSVNVARAAYLLTGNERAYRVGLCHDAGEIDGIDRTPYDAEDPQVKLVRERRNVRRFSAPLKEAGEAIWRDWNEYALRTTPLALVVKELDTADAVVKAIEYRPIYGAGLAEEFHRKAVPCITNGRILHALSSVHGSEAAEPRSLYEALLAEPF